MHAPFDSARSAVFPFSGPPSHRGTPVHVRAPARRGRAPPCTHRLAGRRRRALVPGRQGGLDVCDGRARGHGHRLRARAGRVADGEAQGGGRSVRHRVCDRLGGGGEREGVSAPRSEVFLPLLPFTGAKKRRCACGPRTTSSISLLLSSLGPASHRPTRAPFHTKNKKKQFFYTQ